MLHANVITMYPALFITKLCGPCHEGEREREREREREKRGKPIPPIVPRSIGIHSMQIKNIFQSSGERITSMMP